MSLDTYITSVLTVIVATGLPIFASFILEIIKAKDNKPGKKFKATLRKIGCLLIIIDLIIISVLTFLYYKSTKTARLNNFESAMVQADFDFRNKTYIDAAEHYSDAATFAYDNKTKVQALYYMGVCYLEEGLISDNEKYFTNALEVYNEILCHSEYSTEEYYQDALIDTCLIFQYSNSGWDEELIDEVAGKIEATYDFSTLDCIADEEVDLLNKVALTLGSYYRKKLDKSISSELMNLYSEKALFYYNIVSSLMPRADMMHFKNTEMIDLYPRIADFMVKHAISTRPYDDAILAFDDAIAFCKSTIDSLEKNDESNSLAFSVYILLEAKLGRAYIAKLLRSGDIDCAYSAYQELRPLLHLSEKDRGNDEDVLKGLFDVGYYAIQTGMCTDEEIDIILDQYELYWSKNSLSSQSETYTHIKVQAYIVCYFVTQLYENCDRAITMSESLMSELENELGAFLSEQDKSLYETYKADFATHDDSK